MNIHIVSDEKFVNQSFERFEKYYPNQNIFFVQVSRNFDGKLKYVKLNDKIIPICLTKRGCINIIAEYLDKKDNNLFVHYLRLSKAYIANKLSKKYNIKTHWIFYGSDLYSLLVSKGVYQLHDTKKQPLSLKKKIRKGFKKILTFTSTNPINKFIEDLDFFCFWNYYDFLLLKKHFKTKAEFKLFRYFANSMGELEDFSENNNHLVVMVNHSASTNGNHSSVLEKLKEIDKSQQIKKLILPLSYGNETVVKYCTEYGKIHFDYCFQPILDFMPKEEYYLLLSRVGIAFFGHRRQEGGNNIFHLLSIGTKVFLRKENNLFHYLIEKGYHIYDFDADFNSIESLTLLNLEQQKHNRQLVYNEFSQEYIDEVYESLIPKSS